MAEEVKVDEVKQTAKQVEQKLKPLQKKLQQKKLKLMNLNKERD